MFLATGFSGVLLLLYPVMIFIITRKRSLNSASQVDTSAGIQIIFAIIALFLGLRFFLKNTQILKNFVLKGPTLFLVCYTLLGLLSAFWSSNPTLTIYRAIECLAFLLLIHMVVIKMIDKYDFKSIIVWVAFYAVWNLVFDALTLIKFRGFDFLIYPFTASRLFFPLFFFIFMFLVNSKSLKVLMLLFAILGLSNKIYFGICAGMISLIFSGHKYKFYFIFIAIFLYFLYLFLGIEDLLLSTVYYGRESTGLDDSSGRNQIWTFLYEQALNKPIFGHGFVAGETNLLSNSVFNGAINAHNSFMSAFVNNGIIGLLLIIIYFISAIKYSFSTYFPKNKWLPAIIGTIFLVFIVNMAAPGIGSRVYGSWLPSVFIITMILGLRIKFKRLKKNQLI